MKNNDEHLLFKRMGERLSTPLKDEDLDQAACVSMSITLPFFLLYIETLGGSATEIVCMQHRILNHYGPFVVSLLVFWLAYSLAHFL